MTANIIENGQDQLVLLPNGCRFTGDEVVISKIGEAVILLPHKGVLQIKVNRFFSKIAKKYSADSRVKMRTANRTPSKIGGSQVT